MSTTRYQGNQELLRRHRNGVTVLLQGGHVCLSAVPFSHALLLFGGGGVSHEFCRELAPFEAARAALLFNSACARAVPRFATVGRVRCSQRVGAGTFVGYGMNTLHPTGLATRNEAPVGTVLWGLGGVSKPHCHLIDHLSPRD